ncbi:hypothetical protein ACFYYM_22455 [Streptomyces erythrochromogenes]|uniref:hypothetical protein n=1 Tax=Streptomyces erythrochromogenes TaxID=285574 RepID=UPI00367FC544
MRGTAPPPDTAKPPQRHRPNRTTPPQRHRPHAAKLPPGVRPEPHHTAEPRSDPVHR